VQPPSFRLNNPTDQRALARVAGRRAMALVGLRCAPQVPSSGRNQGVAHAQHRKASGWAAEI